MTKIVIEDDRLGLGDTIIREATKEDVPMGCRASEEPFRYVVIEQRDHSVVVLKDELAAGIDVVG